MQIHAEGKNNSIKSNPEKKIVFSSQIYRNETKKVIKELIKSENEKLIKEFLANKKFFERFTSESLAKFVVSSLDGADLSPESLAKIKKDALNWLKINAKSSNLNTRSLDWLNQRFKEKVLYSLVQENSSKINKFLFEFYYSSESNIKNKTPQELIEIVIGNIESLQTRRISTSIEYEKVKYPKDEDIATIIYIEPGERESKMKFLKRKINNNNVWFPIENCMIAAH
jgi:hypothetical protein